MLLSHHQKAGQNHDIEMANRLFENVSQFKYLETTLTNQSCQSSTQPLSATEEPLGRKVVARV
jgi:hypothetical protein